MGWSGHRIAILICVAALAGVAHSAAAQAASPRATAAEAAKAAPPGQKPFCPTPLPGGSRTAPKTVTDPAQADPSNAAALVEYAFTAASLATYKRDSETLSVRALRFHDASGRTARTRSIATTDGRRTDRHRRNLGPQPCSLLARQYRDRCQLPAYQPDVRFGAARAGQPIPVPRAQGESRRPSWPTCPRPSSIRRRPITPAGPPAIQARAECFRRSWSASTRARRRLPRPTTSAPARPLSPSSTTPPRRWPLRRKPGSATTSKPVRRPCRPGPSR